MIKTYYLIFSERDTWYAKYLKPTFSHVDIYWHYSQDIYLGLEAGKALSIVTRKGITKKKAEHMLLVDIDTAKVITPIFPFKFGFFNCAVIAKYVLGLRSFSVTPCQLFRYLIRYKNRSKSNNKHILKVEVL